jgi:hypothetical protein
MLLGNALEGENAVIETTASVGGLGLIPVPDFEHDVIKTDSVINMISDKTDLLR